MSKDHDTSDETNPFREAMKDVVPLQSDEKINTYRSRRKPVPLNLTVDENEDDDSFADSHIETHDELSFQKPGIQNRLFQDLRRGYIEPENTLDLHGMRVIEARTSMGRFLKHALRNHYRCVLIIHGKGRGSKEQQPVLKQKTNQWLRQKPEVLAFCSAPSWNGGTGATYVLLSRKYRDPED